MTKAPPRPGQTSGITSYRPVISARRHVVSAGHYLAAHAGFAVLEAGGNAIDAGVAAGIALGVLQSDLVNVAGVAPIILYHAESRKVFTVSGLGPWPKRVTPDYFMKHHGGKIPRGLLRTVVPAAPDAWIQTLQRWGSMSFGDVAAASVRFAKEGFAAHPLLCETITTHRKGYEEWPSNRAIYLPNGCPPRVGEIFVQADLAKSLQYMIDEERAAVHKGRDAGLEAARSAFYTGDIGRTIVAYHEQNGGLLRMDDLAGFRSGIEASVSVPFGEFSVHTCGPWCQGPVLGQMLRLVEASGCHKHAHNSFDYVHTLTEIMKLAFADRHAYYGDPNFMDVPLDRLLSPSYAAERASLIRADKAWPDMPPPGLERGPGKGRQGAQSDLAPAAARHVLRLRRGPPRQRVLGDAERRLEQHPRHSGNRVVPVLARLPVLGRPVADGIRRAGQAAEAHAESGTGTRPRRTRYPVRHARRRRAGAGDAADPPQPHRVRNGPASRRRGAALCHLQLPRQLRAAQHPAGAARAGGTNAASSRRSALGRRSRRAVVAGLDLEGRRHLHDRQRAQGRPAPRRRRSPSIHVRGGLVGALQTQQPLGVAAADARRRLTASRPAAADVADGVVVAHVEGIVGAHEDLVGAVEAHELLQLVRREHDRVEVDAS